MIQLYQHNMKAVEAIERHYAEGSRKAAVVHATGTGKSYIIAAIVEQYGKCIVLAPNDYVLGETRKICKEGTEFSTYTYLMYDHVTATDYDLIVLDEFHRAGAQFWGEAVRTLIETNPQARLLGTTATDIRYLDGMRNMSDELFDGNVVSRLSLAEAWVQKILVPPVYVTGLYTFDSIAESFNEKVVESSKLTGEEKAKALSAMEGIRLDWIKADGLSEIFEKHLRKDTKRIVVFCEHIKHIEEVMVQSIQWLANAGFKVNKTYTANVLNRNSAKEIEDFEKNGYEGIKVMFSVNMLNEGIHVPNVDAVVMLRPTTSKIIHLQQIGRCMTADNKRQPVIFDLVDNLNNSSVIDDVQREYKRLYVRRNEEKEPKDEDSLEFIVKDYVYETRKVIETLERDTFANFDDMREELIKWCQDNGRLPVRKNAKSDREKKLYDFMFYRREEDFVKELRQKYGYVSMKDKTEENKAQLIEFCEKNGRLPKGSVKEEERMYGVFKRFYNNAKVREQWIIELVEKYPRKHLKKSQEEKIEMIKAFCEANDRIPTDRSEDEYERSVASAYKKLKYHSEVIDIRRKYINRNNAYLEAEENEGVRAYYKRKLIEFVEANGYLPPHSRKGDDNKSMASYWSRFRNDDEEVRRIFDTYPTIKEYNRQKRKEELIEFIKTNRRAPKSSESLYQFYWKVGRFDKDIVELLKQY